MPGRNNQSSQPDPTRGGDYYCGANAGKHGGNFCPEIDVLEANMYTMQARVLGVVAVVLVHHAGTSARGSSGRVSTPCRHVC